VEPLHAQAADPVADAVGMLNRQSAELQAIDTAFNGRTTPGQRQDLRARATAVRQATAEQIDTLGTELKQVDARIAQLGPATPDIVEAPDIQAERVSLARERSTLDSAIKRGKLLAVDADQLGTEIGRSSADVFSERMSQRTASPLSPDFWRALAQHDLDLTQLPDDLLGLVLLRRHVTSLSW